jgi:hypothetical protein
MFAKLFARHSALIDFRRPLLWRSSAAAAAAERIIVGWMDGGRGNRPITAPSSADAAFADLEQTERKQRGYQNGTEITRSRDVYITWTAKAIKKGILCTYSDIEILQ